MKKPVSNESPEKSKCLYLFTATFPFGSGESFIENELLFLAARFEKVIIFPLIAEGEPRLLPSNCEVVCLFSDWKYSGSGTIRKNPFLFAGIFLSEFLRTPGKRSYLKMRRQLRSHLLQCISRYVKLKDYLELHSQTEAVFYSFWFNDWATILSILSRKKNINGYFARVHGYDLYLFRRDEGIMPFRYFQLKHVKKVGAVSLDGFNYLKSNYPKYQHKFFLAHLSVYDKGQNVFQDSTIYTVVSCSNVIPVKRVAIICDALKEVRSSIHWIHFGDGSLMDELRLNTLKLSENIQVSLKGKVSNNAIIEFYKSNTVHLFVHVSESEGGVPIAIQEAVSFGIPVIAAQAGGVPEIVNDHTGLLIPTTKFSAAELAAEIDKFLTSVKNTEAFRREVKTFWQNSFSAEKNYDILWKVLTA